MTLNYIETLEQPIDNPKHIKNTKNSLQPNRKKHYFCFSNIHMAVHPEDFPDAGATALYIRLVFQLGFFAWAWWATQPDAENIAAEAAA